MELSLQGVGFLDLQGLAVVSQPPPSFVLVMFILAG